ncbi:hypothetical protein DPMN_092269, partial [Dreissena polymorpha]
MTDRFTVTPASEAVPIGGQRGQEMYGAAKIDFSDTSSKVGKYSRFTGEGTPDDEPFARSDELSNSDYSNQMALYEDDIHHQGKISALLNRLANYHAGVEPNTSEKKGKVQAKARLGTLLGVFLPCVQNIFGVLLFIRMSWIVGMAGALEGFFIVFICCCC